MFIYQASGHEYVEGNTSQFSLSPTSVTIPDQASDELSKLVAGSWPAHEPHHTIACADQPPGLTNDQCTMEDQADIHFRRKYKQFCEGFMVSGHFVQVEKDLHIWKHIYYPVML